MINWLPLSMLAGIGFAFFSIFHYKDNQLNCPLHYCEIDRKSYFFERWLEKADWYGRTHYLTKRFAGGNWFCYDYDYQTTSDGKTLYVKCERCNKIWVIPQTGRPIFGYFQNH